MSNNNNQWTYVTYKKTKPNPNPNKLTKFETKRYAKLLRKISCFCCESQRISRIIKRPFSSCNLPNCICCKDFSTSGFDHYYYLFD